jgi:hypothetical protein
VGGCYGDFEVAEAKKQLREKVQHFLQEEATALKAQRDSTDPEDMGAGLDKRADLNAQIDSLTGAAEVLRRLSAGEEIEAMVDDAEDSDRLEELKEVLPKPHADYVP